MFKRYAMQSVTVSFIVCILLARTGAAASTKPQAPAFRGKAAALHVGSLGTAMGSHGAGMNGNVSLEPPLPTFTGFYHHHVTGRGIWKWQNALEAYQKHWAPLASHPVRVAEVGVQSGGSMLMWKAVFGSSCRVYGIDINPKCLAFQDASTSITIGDQGDPVMWQSFFSKVCKSLDILVDDGGHEAHQMLTTLNSAFPQLNSGGYVAIEDIHGTRYLESFFQPAAQFLAEQAQIWHRLASIHVYPFVLMVKRAGKPAHLPATELSFGGAGVAVDSFERLWSEVRRLSNTGGHVILENPAWGPFFTAQALDAFFSHFNDLHGGSWTSDPPGCASTAQAICTNTVINNPMQDLITGYHIYPTRVVVEVSRQPQLIRAVRRGSQWKTYS